MSVTTTADERLSSAQEHIKAACGDLAAIVIDECWGHDDYMLGVRDEIRATFNTLIRLKSKLQG